MAFLPEKCELLRITKKHSPIDATYKLQEHVLRQLDCKTYLGVTIQKTLCWSDHVQYIYTKAINTLSLLRRNMGSCPRSVKETCYNSLVRSQVEYSSTVWDPYTAENIAKLESIQRRAAKFVTNNYKRIATPSAMINELGWESLAERRAKAKATITYKIINGHVQIPKETFSYTSAHHSRSNAPLLTHYCRTDTYKCSFFPNAARLRITVPADIRDKQTLTAFMNSIVQIKLI